MSIAGQDLRFRKSTSINGNVPSTLEEYWPRPNDWLTLPAVSTSEQKFVGLFAVFDQINNFIAVKCVGAYTVDWGDGSSPVNVASNVLAQYNYDYNSISSTTDSSRGYRQVIVTITPQAGQNLTSVDVIQGNTSESTTNSNTTCRPWLDMRMSLPNATTVNLTTNGNFRSSLVENIEVLASNTNLYYKFVQCNALNTVYFKSSATMLDTRGAFQNCTNLRNITLDVNIGAGCDGGNMFNSCRSLIKSPSMNFGSTGYFWTLQDHFTNCSMLQEVFVYPTANTTIFTRMFQGCVNLKAAPAMTTTSATAMDSMFNGCTNLLIVPYYDLNGVTTVANMFQNCVNLTSIPEFDFSTVTNITTMFSGCSSLISVPNSLSTTGNITSLSATFSGCGRLTSLPMLTTNNVTNFTNTFQGCQNVTIIPNYNSTSTTSFVSTFSGCTSLQAINMSPLQGSVSFTGTQIQIPEMEQIFTNFPRTTTARTLSISSTPAAFGINVNGTTTGGSNTMTVTSAASLNVGMFVLSTYYPSSRAVTFQDAGDTVTLNNHGMSDGKAISFSVITTTTGIINFTTYYVVNATTNTFQLESTPGGGVLPLTSDGTGTMLAPGIITNIAGNTLTLDMAATGAGTVNTTFRNLDYTIATYKGYTVSF